MKQARPVSSVDMLAAFLWPKSTGSTDSPWAYRPDVDGLRAIAAITVLLHHAGWLPYAGSGVDIFFVVSGFLISGITFRALERGRFSFIDFYARRIKRIFPALILLLGAVWAVGWWLLSPQQYERLGEDIAAGAGFAENLWFYSTHAERSQLHDFIITHLWTLGIQEQFYVIWPIFLWATWRLGKGVFILLLATAAGISFASYLWMASRDAPAASLLPWHRLWELALGGVLAYAQLLKSAERSQMPVASAVQVSGFTFLDRGSLGAIGAICLLGSILGLLPFRAGHGSYVLMTSLSTFLLIHAGPRCWFNRYVLGSRPLVFVGLMSYPLYLWHVSVLVLLPIVQANGYSSMTQYPSVPLHIKIAAVVGVAVLSYGTYKYVELPIQSLERTKRVAGILCITMALFGCLAYLVSR